MIELLSNNFFNAYLTPELKLRRQIKLMENGKFKF